VGDSFVGECARRLCTPIAYHYKGRIVYAAGRDSTLAHPSSPSLITLAKNQFYLSSSEPLVLFS
jgi:hypothetical protein